MDDIRDTLISRLVNELKFKRLDWHGLAEKKVLNKNLGYGCYIIHINGVYDFKAHIPVPGKIEVCVEANMDDDYFSSVPVMVTDKIEDITAMMAAIKKDHYYLVKLFEESGEPTIVPTVVL